ncbi:MAG: hypothetical protein ACTSYE_11895 [Alphaproteobacteria bacterium]
MNKMSKIALAVALSASLVHTTPVLAVETTARDFVQSLSLDFAAEDLISVEFKLNQLSEQGFEGIYVDGRLVTVERLVWFLSNVRAGDLDGDRVAASLEKLLSEASRFQFIYGDVRFDTVDLRGPVFPAGSAA